MICADCRAFCCSIYIVTATEDELKDIAAFCSIPVEEIRRRTWEAKDGARGLGTKKIGKMDYCFLLDSETFRCGVYGVRPEVCRRFKCFRFGETGG
jgi:Fe-S-cluster containining protein